MNNTGYVADILHFNGFTYQYDNAGHYKIIRDSDCNRAAPSTFYKYYALNDYSVDAITNLYIYATHPNQFNDPMDCFDKLITFDTKQAVQSFWDCYYEQICHDYPNYNKLLEQTQKGFHTELYRHVGLVSLTPNPANSQMWALYAQKNGFCVGFDISKFHFHHFGPFPINYIYDWDYVEPFPISKGSRIAMLYQTNLKDSGWRFEKEWRLYIPNPEGLDMKSFGPFSERYNRLDDHDRKFRYPFEAIRSISFASEFFSPENRYNISDYEMEVRFEPSSLACKMLNFICEATRFRDIELRIANPQVNEISLIPITIFKLSDTSFRIIETDNIKMRSI